MKKKILFIIPYLIGGGALKTVSNLSKEFLKKYDVTVVGIYGSEKKFDFDCNLIDLNMHHQKNIFKKFKDFLYIRKKIKMIKEHDNFAFSISFLVIADFVNVLTKSKNKEKTIISIRNIESIEYKNKWYRRFQVKYSSKKADYIIAISKEVEDDMINNFGVKKNKIRTIYNPCILNHSNNDIDDSLIEPDKTVITLGGLKNQKGQWHLIRAFSRVVEKIPNAKLLIFGKGDLKDYLEELIKQMKLSKNVFLMGYIIGPYEYVKKSNLFVFSSLFEGLGNAMMEALKCGVPVISTDYTSGAREILAPRTNYKIKIKDKIDFAEYGILVPVCDGNKYESTNPLTKEEILLADAIYKVLIDKNVNKKYSIQSKKRANDFDIKNISNQWYELFDELEEIL